MTTRVIGGLTAFVVILVSVAAATLADLPDPDSLCWIRTGGPQGGLGYDIRVNPEDPDIWFVTDSKSGLHMSTDGGQTWFVSNRGIDVRVGRTGDLTPVFSLTLDPQDPQIVWAGTQSVLGIYKSTDGGKTWQRKVNGIKETEGISFRGIGIDPSDSNVVYAAAELTSWTWTDDHEPRNGKSFDLVMGVVYRTVDAGENWTEIWRGDNLARYVLIHPLDPNILYVSTGIFDREAANSDLRRGVTGGVGIAKSLDGGETWSIIDQRDGLGHLYVGSLAMNPEDPDVLLAGTGVNGTGTDQTPGVYLSEDGGESWRLVMTSGRSAVTAVEFGIDNPDLAYAGTEHEFYRSEDRGRTWTRFERWGPETHRVGFPIDFQVHPDNAWTLFANNYAGGNFHSTDGGTTWSDASNGYSGNDVWEIAVHPTDPETIYVAGLSGAFRSRDGGTTWEGLNSHHWMMRMYSVAIDPKDPRVVLFGDSETGLYRTTTGTSPWDVAFRNRALGESGQGIRALTFAPSDPSIVYASLLEEGEQVDNFRNCGGRGLLRSVDGGAHWAPILDESMSAANFFDIAVHPGDPDTFYAGSICHGLYRSTDGGASMEKLASFPCTPVAVIVLHPDDPETLFVGTNGCGILKTTDGGGTWEQKVRGLPPEAAIRGLVIDPLDSSVMYAGDEFSGVYRSMDGGESWALINNGLLVRTVRTLAISADGTTVYAGTNGGGVFRLDTRGQAQGEDCREGSAGHDRDEDGVPDAQDLCPDYPGDPTMQGC